ncbi:MAG: protease inhibitor I42 family protein [Actinomycetota bacterium]|nr:MAG: inhibitor of cysteine [Actinomycetota bacterium]MDO8948955.1 protease inhibitor I42 family protein [Actinomycetota bacterium]MDP3630640.1 protease inhibitor I42 family protein [Actinomycetota bacterium]
MKRLCVGILIAALVVVALAACAEKNAVVDDTLNGKSAAIGSGGTLEVRLPSNPSTGYAWQVLSVPGFMTQDGPSEFKQGGAAGAVGASGIEVLRFTSKEGGSGTLKLEYRRSWETTTPAEKTYTLEVTSD